MRTTTLMALASAAVTGLASAPAARAEPGAPPEAWRSEVVLDTTLGATHVVARSTHCCAPYAYESLTLEGTTAGAAPWSHTFTGDFALARVGDVVVLDSTHLDGDALIAMIDARGAVHRADGAPAARGLLAGDGFVIALGVLVVQRWNVTPDAAPTLAWSHDAGIIESVPAVLAAGRVFFATEGGSVVVLDAERGDELWRRSFDDRIGVLELRGGTPATGGRPFIEVESFADSVEHIDPAAPRPPEVEVHLVARVVPTKAPYRYGGGGVRTLSLGPGLEGVDVHVGDMVFPSDGNGVIDVRIRGSGRVFVTGQCLERTSVPLNANRTYRLRIRAARLCDGE
ncbi:MAG: hypothetical protein U1F43_04075 [Myxococcota bacterium]